MPRKKKGAEVKLWASGEHPFSGHVNAVAWDGCLTLLDTPSDKAPSGARGHKIVITRAAAEAALPSLLGMAVDYKAGWDGHDARQKCGIITSAHIDDKRLLVSGFLFAKDFPEVGMKLNQPDADMGMSFEIHNAQIADMRATVWTVAKLTFTGASILLREKAAYRGTSLALRSSALPVPEQLPLAASMKGKA